MAEGKSIEESAGDMKTAYTVFDDVFRRMDKNDDNKIQIEEFLEYFGDDMVSDKDLAEMFQDIDANKDGTLSLDEVIDYFKLDFKAWIPTFSSLFSINSAVSSSLAKSSKEYAKLNYHQQFKVRFYAREVLFLLESLYDTVRVSFEHLNSQTECHRVEKQAAEDDTPHFHDTMSIDFRALQAQLENLAKALKLPSESPKLLSPDSTAKIAKVPPFHVNRIEMIVDKKGIEDYMESLQEYVGKTQDEQGCHHVFVQRLSENVYCLYEVWKNSELMKHHHSTLHYKNWAKQMVDLLESPASFSSMPLPASWWPGK